MGNSVERSFSESLKNLSDEELLNVYIANYKLGAEAHERVLDCEDEHHSRHLGAVALRTLMEYPDADIIDISEYSSDDEA